MRNTHVKYTCYPSVVEVGKKTEVRIFPSDPSRIFRAECEYELCVVGLFEDQLDYHAHIPLDFPCYVKDGCLCFEHTFEYEQKYSVRFCKKGEKEIKIEMYAVNSDLYALRPLKGDLHTHTFYSDGGDGISVTPADYREQGFDFFSLTDHNRMFTSVLMKEQFDGINLGMNMLLGEEVHTPGSLVHIVHAGGNQSVCDMYIRNRDAYEAEVDEIEKTLVNINKTYRRRAAMAVWACDKIHKAGGIAIFAHPYWCPNRNNVSDEFIDILFDLKIFDAFELIGGINFVGNNMQLSLWQHQCMKGNVLPVVGSSDSHNHDFNKDGFGRRTTIVFAKDNSTAAILDAVKNGLSVACELPLNNNDELRVYGDLRLVRFTQFLFANYFNITQSLCVGEGVLMRRFAQGEDVANQLNAAGDTVGDFYNKFYGKGEPVCVCDRVTAFLKKCREVQTTIGPKTKGSDLNIYGANERRE